MTEPKVHHRTNWYGYPCSKEIELARSYQVRPYYDGSERLEILHCCPECGAYVFTEFEPEDDE